MALGGGLSGAAGRVDIFYPPTFTVSDFLYSGMVSNDTPGSYPHGTLYYS